jgi:hypothetical protein
MCAARSRAQKRLLCSNALVYVAAKDEPIKRPTFGQEESPTLSVNAGMAREEAHESPISELGQPLAHATSRYFLPPLLLPLAIEVVIDAELFTELLSVDVVLTVAVLVIVVLPLTITVTTSCALVAWPFESSPRYQVTTPL